MENATYRKYQNFFGEVDEEKERDTIQSLMRPEDYKILELCTDLTLDHLIDGEHQLAYRLMLENEEEINADNFESWLNVIFSNVVFNYYTDDTEALQKNPIDYLSDNYSDLYDDEGFAIYDDTGERTADGKKLEVDPNHCYVIDGWIYEIR